MEVPPFNLENRNEYEIILNYISDRINNDEIFSGYAKSEIYEYTKKNQSNVLHLKGVKTNPNEDPTALAEELKEFIQRQGPQWNIVNAYASIYEKRGAWANLTFSTYEETIQAYNHLKDLRPKFRDNTLYGSLRNVKDPRTIVVSVVKKDVTEKQVERFLIELASKSAKINSLSEDNLRKYDFFSFNIIESKKFFKIDGDETKGITEADKDQVHPSWIEINEVPRRLIIHFFHEFSDEDIKDLNNDITVTPGYDEIFMKGDSKKQLRSNHQKGHVNKEGIYIKHTDIKGKKKVKQVRTDKPMRRPLDPSQRPLPHQKFGVTKPNIDFGMGGLPLKGAPKMPGNLNMPQHSFRPPQVGAMGNIGNMPPTGGQMPMRPPQPFNSAQSFPGGNIPPAFKPGGNFQIPAGMGGPGMGAPGMPPLGSMPGPKLGPSAPLMVPPTGMAPFQPPVPKLQPPQFQPPPPPRE